MASPFETTPVDGHEIAFRRFGAGAGAPPLLLVHGLFGDSSTVAALAHELSASFDVIALDALGHGHSSHPSEFTLDDQARAVLGLATALGLDRFALVGISMGSYIAQAAAIRDPARISSLVLVVSKAHGLTSSSAAYAARHGFDLAAATDEEAFAFLAGAVWSPDTSEADRRRIGDELVADVALTPPERAAVEASLAGFDLRPTLPLMTAPTLVLSGAADGLNPPSAGQEVAELIRGAVFRVYEHSGHALASEERERFVADVVAFAGLV
ncbi:alpha/beta fold hydrolase [Frondihabitans australicus]|uniref:3-oxoadipate enol-lactonase n=1 Tax=Frondihabitans australicus TaxID=386892 RepID=A0A495IGZ7_9MICO|nr:alpha/beta hydrolase [Frondihabitans australicus]RKR75039.1 3-oxoadipate enol-lactonase [Frondihabitans australicus]